MSTPPLEEWRTLSWIEFCDWVQGKQVVSDDEDEEGTQLVRFMDACQAKFTSATSDGVNLPPRVMVSEPDVDIIDITIPKPKVSPADAMLMALMKGEVPREFEAAAKVAGVAKSVGGRSREPPPPHPKAVLKKLLEAEAASKKGKRKR